jgi:hypothetical protein
VQVVPLLLLLLYGVLTSLVVLAGEVLVHRSRAACRHKGHAGHKGHQGNKGLQGLPPPALAVGRGGSHWQPSSLAIAASQYLQRIKRQQ